MNAILIAKSSDKPEIYTTMLIEVRPNSFLFAVPCGNNQIVGTIALQRGEGK